MMRDVTLTHSQIRAGQWEGVLHAPGGLPVSPELLHDGQPLGGVICVPEPGDAARIRVTAPIPAALLSDGVQTFLVRLPGAPEPLARFSIVTGRPFEDDLRAEIDLLRAELDLLKRAFRQHLADTDG